MDILFSDNNVSVDTSVYNAARITKLYGTTACKGDNTTDRPHRQSKILKVPENIETVPVEMIQKLADTVPSEPSAATNAANSSFDLDAWITEHELDVAFTGPWQGGTKWVLETCPWNPEHTNRSAYIVRHANGAIAAGCHHNSCQGKGWQDLRDLLEPGWRSGEEQSESGQNENDGGRKNLANQLIELAIENASFFHNQFNEPFSCISFNGHKEIWPIKGRSFKWWLSWFYYNKTGKSPSTDSLNQALQTLEAKAYYDGPQYRLHLRVAEHNGVIYYDLGDSIWRTVKITPGKWEIENDPPILFRRHANTAAQVKPATSDGNIRMLLDFINLKNKPDQNLLLVYVVTCLIPEIPHTIPIFHGEKGAAKSTAMRVLRKLIDPASQETLDLPTSHKELPLILAHNYMPAFDNLDNLQGWQSNMFCVASTGGGISKRELFSDDNDKILEFKRCVTLNGINLVATRPDLLDRALLFELERINEEKRQEESEFWRKFEEARPYIVAGLFDTLAKAMEIYPTVKLPNLPRMADFCRYGYAIAEALEIGGENFLRAYSQNIGQANQEALINNPVAAAVNALMSSKNKWEGTMTDLLTKLDEIADIERINKHSKGWPKASNSLSRHMKQVKSNLSDAGIKYYSRPSTNTGTKNHSWVVLEKETKTPSPKVTGLESLAEILQSGGDTTPDGTQYVHPEKACEDKESGDIRDGGGKKSYYTSPPAIIQQSSSKVSIADF